MQAPTPRGFPSLLGASSSVATTSIAKSIERAGTATPIVSTKRSKVGGPLNPDEFSVSVPSAGSLRIEPAESVVARSGIYYVDAWAGVDPEMAGTLTVAIADADGPSATKTGLRAVSFVGRNIDGSLVATATFTPDDEPETWPTLTLYTRAWKLR